MSGRSGGLLTVWDKNTFTCEFVVKEDDFVAVVGRWVNVEGLVGCINVYRPREQKERKVMWEKLDLLCKKEDIKWVIFATLTR